MRVCDPCPLPAHLAGLPLRIDAQARGIRRPESATSVAPVSTRKRMRPPFTMPSAKKWPRESAGSVTLLARSGLGGVLEVLAHLERLALAVDLEHRALRIRGDELHALGGGLSDGKGARRAAIHRDHRLAWKEPDHGHVGRVSGRRGERRSQGKPPLISSRAPAKPVAVFRFSDTEGPGHFATFLDANRLPWKLVKLDEGDRCPPRARPSRDSPSWAGR